MKHVCREDDSWRLKIFRTDAIRQEDKGKLYIRGINTKYLLIRNVAIRWGQVGQDTRRVTVCAAVSDRETTL